MDKRHEIIEILNDLVRVNNDRIESYKNAVKAIDDEDPEMRTLFERMIAQSMLLKSDLSEEIEVMHGDMATGTTGSGKIYRLWSDLKTAFTGNDPNTILESCEFGEDATYRAYGAALEAPVIPDFIHETLQHQQIIIRESQDKLKALRNVHA
jgi:uncharacterized protein (TIGR02284 family)